jgi:hypothetical protein
MDLRALVTGCAILYAMDARAQSPAPAATAPPVSVERVRDRLQRPPAFRLPPEPDFRANVEEDYQLRQTALDMLRQDLSGESRGLLPVWLSRTGQQIVGVDLIQLAMAVNGKMQAIRRARGERNARREVAAVLAEFCQHHDCAVLEQELDTARIEGILTH